jgi:hypothetical protein
VRRPQEGDQRMIRALCRLTVKVQHPRSAQLAGAEALPGGIVHAARLRSDHQRHRRGMRAAHVDARVQSRLRRAERQRGGRDFRGRRRVRQGGAAAARQGGNPAGIVCPRRTIGLGRTGATRRVHRPRQSSNAFANASIVRSTTRAEVPARPAACPMNPPPTERTRHIRGDPRMPDHRMCTALPFTVEM